MTSSDTGEAAIERAIAKIEALEAELARLSQAFVEQVEDSMWSAYYMGYEENETWDHMCRRDCELLAYDCGFDGENRNIPVLDIKAAIPIAAKRRLDNFRRLKTGEAL